MGRVIGYSATRVRVELLIKSRVDALDKGHRIVKCVNAGLLRPEPGDY